MDHFPLVTTVFIPNTEEACPFTSRPAHPNIEPLPDSSHHRRGLAHSSYTAPALTGKAAHSLLLKYSAEGVEMLIRRILE